MERKQIKNEQFIQFCVDIVIDKSCVLEQVAGVAKAKDGQAEAARLQQRTQRAAESSIPADDFYDSTLSAAPEHEHHPKAVEGV
jgi:hypothetical protein